MQVPSSANRVVGTANAQPISHRTPPGARVELFVNPRGMAGNAAWALEKQLRGVSGGRLRCCAWSPRGLHLASAWDDGTVQVWHVATGREVANLKGHDDYVYCCAWSPDGSLLASASADKTVRVWDVSSWREVVTLEGYGNKVNSCAWSPDGARLASASDDRSVRVWEVSTGREVANLKGHDDYVLSCAWNPDGSLLASASVDRTVRVWHVNTRHEVYKLREHVGAVVCCAWRPDGSQLASSSTDGTVRLWDVAMRREVTTLEGHEHGGAMNSCVWSPDGALLASPWDDGSVRVWDVATRREVAKLEGHAGAVISCAWSPDGSRLASASIDKTLRVWLAPAMAPVPTGGHANNVTVPHSSLEAATAHGTGQAHVRSGITAQQLALAVSLAVEVSARDAEAANSRARRLEGEVEVANRRARQLEGDPEALQECSAEELRDLMADTERGQDRVRDAVTRAEVRAAAADSAERTAACGICLTHPKDTALNCGYVHLHFPCLFNHGAGAKGWCFLIRAEGSLSLVSPHCTFRTCVLTWMRLHDAGTCSAASAYPECACARYARGPSQSAAASTCRCRAPPRSHWCVPSLGVQ